MLRSAAKTYIRTMLGEPTAAFWTDPELNNWIDFAQSDIARACKFYERIGYAGYVSTYTVSKTGTTVTKTVGTDFTSADVGKYIYWTSDMSYSKITVYTNATTVTVDNSGTQASQTAYKFTASVANQANYALPPDCILFKHVLIGTARIPPINWDDYLLKVDGDSDDTVSFSSGNNDIWYTHGRHDNKLYFYPAPSDAGSIITVYYYAYPADVAGDSSVLAVTDIFRELIPLYVLWKAWEKDEDFNKAKDYERQYKSMLKEYRAKLNFPRDPLNMRFKNIREYYTDF